MPHVQFLDTIPECKKDLVTQPCQPTERFSFLIENDFIRSQNASITIISVSPHPIRHS